MNPILKSQDGANAFTKVARLLRILNELPIDDETRGLAQQRIIAFMEFCTNYWQIPEIESILIGDGKIDIRGYQIDNSESSPVIRIYLNEKKHLVFSLRIRKDLAAITSQQQVARNRALSLV